MEAEIIQGLVRSALQSRWHIDLIVFQCWKPDATEDYYFYREKVLPEKPLSTSIAETAGFVSCSSALLLKLH